MRLELGMGPFIAAMGGSSFTPLNLGDACVEWWDFRTGGTGAAITTHAGEKGVYSLSQSNVSY